MRFCRHVFCLVKIFLLAMAFSSATELAHADEVVTDLSKRNVAIGWDFRGAKVLLFGAINVDAVNDDPVDVVVVVTGPKRVFMARRKNRVAGMWINTESQSFDEVPGYYSIVSTRPLEQIMKPKLRQSLGLGFDKLADKFFAGEGPGQVEPGAVSRRTEFSQAVVRVQQNSGLYKEDSRGVQIIGGSLFRATIALPANVPTGIFFADIYLFRDGKLVSSETSSLNIQKQGFERLVYSLAFDYPFIYGVVAVILALMAGLAASAVFKKE